MPIEKRVRKPGTAVKASNSTHDGNGGDVKIENQSEQDLLNNMSADTLIDPEEAPGGSTHFSVSAKKKVTAAPTDEQNIGTLDNEVEPAKGYIENASEGDSDFEETLDDDMDEDEVDASLDEELENNNDPTLLEAEGEDADWDAPPPDEGEAPDDDIEMAEDDIAESDDVIEPEEVKSDAEDMSLMDVDGMDDNDVKDVAFATAGTRVLVIKANRIIASMTQKIAAAANRDNVYLTDQFQEVTTSEMAKQGMRKGLKAMGFVAAKVNVAKLEVVNARVEKQVHKTTAAVRKVATVQAQALEQSLAIASVGINRGYFKKQENTLRASLETALIQAGMRNPRRILTQVFASEGPAYAKQIVELAHKIAAMPQESRDGYIQALDMTSEDMDEPDEDMVPIGADGEDANDFEDDVEAAPSTLATAGVARRSGNKVNPGNYSLTASAILSGDQPLFSL